MLATSCLVLYCEHLGQELLRQAILQSLAPTLLSLMISGPTTIETNSSVGVLDFVRPLTPLETQQFRNAMTEATGCDLEIDDATGLRSVPRDGKIVLQTATWRAEVDPVLLGCLPAIAKRSGAPQCKHQQHGTERQCRNRTWAADKLCWRHTATTRKRCSSMTKAGRLCANFALERKNTCYWHTPTIQDDDTDSSD